jgi:hypothetical protein
MENLWLTRRRALSLALAAPFIIRPATAATSQVVVELFTSQGCSSCPPADKLAAELKNQPGVTVMSLNVDYWDYLGWRDTLAKPEYTTRQMDYAHSRGDQDVYTPQMIINGEAHAVGSNQAVVEKAIELARRKAPSMSLQLRATENELIVDVPKGEAGSEATLWLMAIAPAVTVKIERGENSGTSVTYHNVVRQLVPAGMWDGSATTLKLPRKGIITADSTSCVALLQKGKVGPVLGMAQWHI